MKKIALLFVCLCLPLMVNAQYSVSSPDMKVWVSLNVLKERNFDTKLMIAKRMKMTVSVNGEKVLKNKEIGLTVYSHGHRYSFGKLNMIRSTKSTVSVTEENDGQLARLGNQCNYMVLEAEKGILLEVMVFNKGVAYRFSVKGMEDEYKILNVSDVFPDDKAHAILGTFTGDTVLPWRIMPLDEKDKENIVNEWDELYPANKIVSWKDALSSVSIGFTTNWIAGKAWGGVSQSHGVYADFIYKHLYGGISYTPCQQLLYVDWGKSFAPFTGVMGSVHSWDISGRFGYNLPVQNGSDIWSFSPYAVATYMALRQHGDTHPLALPLTNKHHYLVGLGLKVQYMMRERISLGAGYEYQMFTGHQEPQGRSTLIFTIGYGL